MEAVNQEKNKSTAHPKWSKFKEKIRFNKFLELHQKNNIRYKDYLFTLVIILLLYFSRIDYITIWNSNKASLVLSLPFLLFFAWVGWRHWNRSKSLKLETFLAVFSVFLAAWVFIFQTTSDNVTKSNLIKTANIYNCQNAYSLTTINPKTGLLLQPFITDPYINNADTLYQIYGNDGASKILETVYTMQGDNGLIDLIKSLDVQSTDFFANANAIQLTSSYNSQLISSVNTIGINICSPPSQKESLLSKIFSKIGSLFKNH